MQVVARKSVSCRIFGGCTAACMWRHLTRTSTDARGAWQWQAGCALTLISTSKRDVGRRHTFDPLIHPEWPRNSNRLTSLCTQIIILSNDYLSFYDFSDITYYWSTDGVIKDHLPRICLRLFMTVSPKLNARWRQISVSTVIPQQVERTWTCTRFPAREYQAVHLDWNTWLR